MKLFSTLFLLTFLVLTSSAQMVCTPDTTNLDSILVVRPLPANEDSNPDGGIQDCAVVGENFEFTFTLKIDSTYEFGGITVNVDSIAVLGVNGLPEGIDFACGADDCLYLKNTVSCLILQGVPETNNPLQGYNLTIDVIIYANNGAELPLSLPNSQIAPGEYTLNLVADRANAACMTTSTDNVLAQQLTLQNQPNPFSGLTTVAVNALTAGDFTFAVRDLLGQVVTQRTVRLQIGQNTFDYDATNLASGLYLYSLSDGVNVVTEKMMVQ